ncbi:MAG: CarD family transcriptional regulator [Ruminococcaceae bacterium]|nr:CarD family transcriptional regulator [Oscillospiraceae bacterium]
MFHTEETVVYGANGICTIGEITEQSFCGETRQYYVLHPVYDKGATIFVPVDNRELTAKMHRILTKDEVHALIGGLPEEADEWIENDGDRKRAFQEILESGDRKKLMGMIRVLYLRGEQQKKRGKKLHIADERAFREAEKILHEEFAHVLEIPTDQVVPYIASRLEA